MQTTEMKPVQAGANKRLVKLIVALVVAALAVAGLGAAVASANPSGTITGKITEPGGAPLAAGADVQVLAHWGEVGWYGWVQSDGRFTIPGVWEGRELNLEVEDKGGLYAPRRGITAPNIEEGETIDIGSIEIARGAAVTGKITGPGGAPLDPEANIRVDAYSLSGVDGEASEGWIDGTASFDPGTGSFAIRAMPAGQVKQLRFSDDEGKYPTQFVTQDVQLAPGETKALGSFSLALGGKITGKLTGPGGAPLVSHSEPFVTAIDHAGNTVAGGYYESQADPTTGRFEIDGVPAGVIKELRLFPGYGAGSPYTVTTAPVNVVVTTGNTAEAGTFAFDAARKIAGRVTVPGGGPINTCVLATAGVQGEDLAPWDHPSGRVSSSGDFVINLPDSSTFTSLRFDDEGVNCLGEDAAYESQTFPVNVNPARSETVNLGPFALAAIVPVPTGTGVLTGTVTEVGGTPLELGTEDSGATVHVSAFTSDGREVGSYTVVHRGSNGSFSIRDLPAGRITKLDISYDPDWGTRRYGGGEYQIDRDVPAGATVDAGRFELPFAGKLTGALVGPDGTVPANADCLEVSAIESNGNSYDGSISGRAAAGTGRFTVGGITTKPVKRLSVYNTCTDHPYGRASVNAAAEAGEVKDIGQVRVEASGTLKGRVTGPRGSGLNNDARVHVVAYDGDGKQVGIAAEVDRETGDFAITEVPETVVTRVGVYDTGWKGSYSPLHRDVSITVTPDTIVDAGSFELALHAGEMTKPGRPFSPDGDARHQSVRLDWDSWDTDDGGAGITDWIIQYSADGGTNWTTFDDGVSPTSDVVVTGLSDGTPYVFRIAAINIIGQGDWSGASEPVTPAVQRPGESSALTGTAGNGQVSLSWSAPADNGGAQITDYRVYYMRVGEDDWWKVFDDGVSAATSATVTGLSNGVGYRFEVVAVNSAGVSRDGAYSGTVTPVGPPPAPVVVDQHVAGGVPGQVKRKSRKPIALPTATDGGQRIGWSSATPKICKVVKGKLKLTGKKGVCRITGTAAGTAHHRSLRQVYAIRVK